MQQKILHWIMNWFNDHAKVDTGDLLENKDLNYFEQGYVDSLKFILMISDIEEEFNIHFKNDEFQKREFATIGGLSEIIYEKIKSSNPS